MCTKKRPKKAWTLWMSILWKPTLKRQLKILATRNSNTARVPADQAFLWRETCSFENNRNSVKARRKYSRRESCNRMMCRRHLCYIRNNNICNCLLSISMKAVFKQIFHLNKNFKKGAVTWSIMMLEMLIMNKNLVAKKLLEVLISCSNSQKLMRLRTTIKM